MQNNAKQDCLSIEVRPPTTSHVQQAQTRFFAPMTLTYELDLDIMNVSANQK